MNRAKRDDYGRLVGIVRSRREAARYGASAREARREWAVALLCIGAGLLAVAVRLAEFW